MIGFTSGRIPEYKATGSTQRLLDGWRTGRFRKEPKPTPPRRTAAMYAKGQLNPVVTQTFPKEKFVEAFNIFTKRQAKGKVTLEFKSE